VTVVYSSKADASFDFDYYLNQHIPMVVGFLGTSIEVQKGILSPMDSWLPVVSIARMGINSLDHFQTTMAPSGQRILSDIPNYANTEPQLQIEEVVRSH
jgi:uncharacterized protein (TIGR02118 family)